MRQVRHAKLKGVSALQASRPWRSFSRTWNQRFVRRWALTSMIKRTRNFRNVTWLGHPIWQNPLDAWMLQQVIVEDAVDFVIECGTNRAGSAYYMASIFDLLGRGHVVTIDVERLHDLSHPRIEFLIGSSIDPEIVGKVQAARTAAHAGRTLLLLDSDHSAAHVRAELDAYAPLLEVGDPILVQDGCIDESPMFADGRPGPLAALTAFIEADARFVVDHERSDRFLASHSPSGWMKRVR